MRDAHRVLDNRFRLLAPAGHGGMATVYRALDLATGEPVAVKILARGGGESAARFEREISVLAGLSHPGIVRYVAHGLGANEEDAYLAMEWIEGPSLRERIGHAALSVEETARCGLGIARALAAAHAAGIVHRDVKPGNVMLAGGSVDAIKIVDFGVARPAVKTTELTIEGAVVGTVGYMAPEQARGSAVLGPTADVYALGCVLFRCLTGRMPFPGDEIVAVLVKVVLEDAPRASSLGVEVPRWLDDLIAAMLSREPEYRPLGASAVAATIDANLGDHGGRRARTTPPAAGDGAARSAISASERRIGCAVLAAAGAACFTPVFSAEEKSGLAEAARPFGADVCFLADGSVLATIPSEGTATDRAARAARTALALRPLLMGMPLCVLLGPHAAPARVAEAVDRVVPLLSRDGSFAIRLDETAAGLLDARFDIGGDALGLFLRGERDAADVGRTLLGKPTPCVGRDREIGALVALLDEVANEGVSRAALVTGAAGVGKSRLRHEVLRRAIADRPEIQVWIGRSDPLAAGSPFALLGQALRRVAGVTPLDAPDVAKKKLRARVGRHLDARAPSGVTEFLGEVCGLPFSDTASAPLRAARREPALMADQMLRAFETFVRAEGAAGPIVIVLEDLHWGDLPSVRFVDAALRHEHPLFVLALARPEVHGRFPDLFRHRSIIEIGLGSLSKKSSARLAREVLGEGADAALVERIASLSAGNAFYLEELIRAAASGATGALPETVIAMAQSILDTLDPGSRMALRACSVFGGAFRPEGLAALLDVGEAEARGLLAPLIAAELVARREDAAAPGGEEYAFRHAMLREAAYAMLDEEDRALGHKVAGEFLAASGEHDPMVLAEHFERGREPQTAAKFYLRAAEQALAGNDLADAIARAERGIGCGAAGTELGLLRLVQAEAERWRGHNAEGRAHALAALEALPPGGAAWCTAASELASCALKLLEPETVDALGERLLACVADVGGAPSGALVIACARVAAAALLGGRARIGAALLGVLASPVIADGTAAPEVLARVAETRAIAALCEGDPCGFLTGSEAASAAFAEVGDARSATIQRANQGHVYGALGDYERAEAALREVLSAVVHLALPQLLAAAQQNLGNVLLRVGRTDEARALLSASLAGAVAQGDRRLEVGARVYLALCAREAGDPEAAIALVTDDTPTRGMPALHIYALGARSRALLSAGRAAESLVVAERAMASLAEAGGTLEEGEGLVRLAHVEALLAADRASEARAALAGAARAIDVLAARITGDALRASFLDRVPENARIRALARILGAAEAP